MKVRQLREILAYATDDMEVVVEDVNGSGINLAHRAEVWSNALRLTSVEEFPDDWYENGEEKNYDYEEDCRQELREQISPLLNDTSEESPLECCIPIGQADAQGLSTLELPTIVRAFEMEGEGTIWFMIDGEGDYRDFDEFSTDDLRTILKALREEIW